MTDTTSNVQIVTLFTAMNMKKDLRNILCSIGDKGIFIDDRTGKIIELDPNKFALLILENNGDNFICPAFKNTYFTMNKMYLHKDGFAHLSKRQISRDMTYECTSNHQLTLVSEIYNEFALNEPKIKLVIEL